MKIAVITGASSGLGREYVQQVTEQVTDIDEIWLIARRLDRLETIAAGFPHHTFRLLALDVTKNECLEEYRTALKEANAEIRLLINNAGCGKLGNFAEEELYGQLGMVDLNCRALTAVTNLSLPHMVRGSGILNVSSIASYAPTPRMAVYCSTKAYVSSFTHALTEEVKPLGVRVLAACPGPMATEFLDIANITGQSNTFKTLPFCDPASVAKHSLKSLLRGKRWYTPLFLYKFFRFLSKIAPYRFLMKLTKT